MGGNTWNKSVDVFVIHFLGIPENLGEGFYFVILKAKFSDFKYFILCYWQMKWENTLAVTLHILPHSLSLSFWVFV